MSSDRAIHFIAGAVGGTVGAVATCPLEVVKTRLQSSVATFQPTYIQPNVQVNLIPNSYLNINGQVHVHTVSCSACHVAQSTVTAQAERALNAARRHRYGLLYRRLKYVIQTEGKGALFKGLGPSLVGVTPSRGIVFFVYANTKNYLNERWTPDTRAVHATSSVTAGLTAATLTNPIWMIKTRLQLDQKRNHSLTASQCIRNIYNTHGLKGFYKGITASYAGVSETMIHFVIYENLKARFLERDFGSENEKQTEWMDFFRCMAAGAMSKITASCIAYPHEVVRTRVREEGCKYRGFFQTLILVGREEGVRALYRGLPTQMVRQIPNTSLMMATYELVVYLFKQWKTDDT